MNWEVHKIYSAFIQLLLNFIFHQIKTKTFEHFKIPVLFFVQASHDGNVSTSVFRYEALMEDDGQFLGCQARNELIENVAVEDQWRIQVHCK